MALALPKRFANLLAPTAEITAAPMARDAKIAPLVAVSAPIVS